MDAVSVGVSYRNLKQEVELVGDDDWEQRRHSSQTHIPSLPPGLPGGGDSPTEMICIIRRRISALIDVEHQLYGGRRNAVRVCPSAVPPHSLYSDAGHRAWVFFFYMALWSHNRRRVQLMPKQPHRPADSAPPLDDHQINGSDSSKSKIDAESNDYALKNKSRRHYIMDNGEEQKHQENSHTPSVTALGQFWLIC